MPAIGFVDARGIQVSFEELEASYDSERWNMPLPVLKSLSRLKRSYCDISVTELVGPPQIRVLKQRHEYVLEPGDLIWATFGTGLHRMLELRSEQNALTEERLMAEFDVEAAGQVCHIRLGGIPDHYVEADGGIFTNYKVTSVYKAVILHEKGPEAASDWVAAENCYAYLMRRHGFEVSRLQVCLLLRDWSARDRDDAMNKFYCSRCQKRHMRDSGPGRGHAEYEDPSRAIWYPPSQIHLVGLPVWPNADCEHYVRERLRAHIAAGLVPDHELPRCTDSETWNGRRCESYCEVAAFCHQRRRCDAHS